MLKTGHIRDIFLPTFFFPFIMLCTLVFSFRATVYSAFNEIQIHCIIHCQLSTHLFCIYVRILRGSYSVKYTEIILAKELLQYRRATVTVTINKELTYNYERLFYIKNDLRLLNISCIKTDASDLTSLLSYCRLV